ncbi:MAG: hypoxanthine phosphoribosyltransferase [Armatimonadetes bacterium]|nr:hypoxanthine phosphoribosyltransferase [Armatimonadota bacterium]
MTGKSGPSLSRWPAEVERVLLTEEQIHARVRELAAKLQADYAGRTPILVGVLNGSVVFLADLMRFVQMPVVIDFIQVSSYGDATQSSGCVRLVKDLCQPIAGRDVVLVEDIVDSGRSLRFLLDELARREPRSLRVCVLLDKPSRREVEVPLDYVGFQIPDYFVVGYGLDFAQQYRNLPYIAVLREEAYRRPSERQA